MESRRVDWLNCFKKQHKSHKERNTIVRTTPGSIISILKIIEVVFHMDCKHAEDRKIDLLKRCGNNINLSKVGYNITDRCLIYSIAQVSVLSISVLKSLWFFFFYLRNAI